jgi:endonuclease-3 related protein
MGLQDVRGDPGLVPTDRRTSTGPWIGRCTTRPRRFARSPALDRLLVELSSAFGPQHWWPAETPFEVLVGAVLVQNTAWTNVERALASLRSASALTPARLLALDEARLAETIRSSGTYRAKARKLQELSRWYLEQGGLRALVERPLEPLRADLLRVHGIGPETADSILCYAAGRRTVVVDAYTRRLLSRHGFLEAEASYESIRGWLHDQLVDSQAVYEEFHALCVRVGHLRCKPTPRCETCPATSPEPR